jgi:hypothetical protein
MTTETIDIDIAQGTTIDLFFTEGSAATSIVINEINYNAPPDADAGDWVELLNPTNNPIDLANWVLKDDDDAHEFVIPEGTVLVPLDYLVVCRNENKFFQVHPDVWPVTGEFDFGLGSNGDAVRLYDGSGALVDSVAYGVISPWPATPNGAGPSLELIHFNYDNALPESWQSSSNSNGTPGTSNSSLTATGNPIIKEGLAITPNPFKEYTMISPKHATTSPWRLGVFAPDGRLCFETDVNQATFSWDGTDGHGNKLPPGVYGIQVWTEEGVFVGRVVLTQ